MAVAVDRNGEFKMFKRLQRCRLQSYSQLDHTVRPKSKTKNKRRNEEPASFHRSLSTPCLNITLLDYDDDDEEEHEEEDETSPRIEIVGGHKAPRVRSLVLEASIAVASGVGPQPLSSGLGGAYILLSRNGEKIAVTKPIDEEPFALNNPKGFRGRMLGQPGIKSSVRIGETGIRELAAYLLDHGGFAGVPPSALVKISHVPFHLDNNNVPYKIASLQRFVDHEFDAGELGPLGFSVTSVHRIGILDVRLLNLDRHAGNILVKRTESGSCDGLGSAELVPIDHGLCLPEWLDDPYFEWLHWPQSSVPFSEPELAYVSDLDPFRDAELLRTEIPSLRKPCVRVLILCTLFLKRAVSSGLCLAAIGKMMSREFCAGEEKPSVLESVCAQAKASITNMFFESRDEEPSVFHIEEDNRHRIITKPHQKLSTSYSAGFISGLSEAVMSPLHEVEDTDNDEIGGNSNMVNSTMEGGEIYHKAPGMVRSKSSLAHNINKETWAVSFGDMNEENWNMFLKNFDGLLPEVLERAKFASQKQRLGSSCKF